MSGGSVPCSESFTFHVSPITFHPLPFAALREIFSLFPEAGGAAVDQEHG